jgi:hypothetical protein
LTSGNGALSTPLSSFLTLASSRRGGTTPHRPESLPELPGRDYRYVLDAVQPQQLFVAGDEHTGPSGNRGAQDETISFVVQYNVRKAAGAGKDSVQFQKANELRGQVLIRAELGPHDRSHLIPNLLGDNQVTDRKDFPQNVRAKPARRYGADQNVSIGQYPHDTTSNTSSSVR